MSSVRCGLGVYYVQACAGLLLGVVRATFDKEKEAALRKTEADRANQELSRFNRLLDTAINDKRKVLQWTEL